LRYIDKFKIERLEAKIARLSRKNEKIKVKYSIKKIKYSASRAILRILDEQTRNLTA
jgi:hypothetical protein